MTPPKKILIIRFSSFGDIIQCLGAVAPLKKEMPDLLIDWITKTEFSELLRMSKDLNRVHLLDKRDGIIGLYKLSRRIRAEKYDVIYDAHQNLRSFLLRFFLSAGNGSRWIVRSKMRWQRFLLFTFRINLFNWPYRGMKSFIEPFSFFGVKDNIVPLKPNFSYEASEKILKLHLPKKFITIVPSAAWAMKRWPLAHWKKIIELSPKHFFVVLGGPNDDFCGELKELAPTRVVNLAGELSLIQSAVVVDKSSLIISADTGLLHVADLFGKKAIALIGPTTFGFPSGETVATLEVDLPCRPCTKDGSGSCSQKVYQRCMVEITPERVVKEIERLFDPN